MPGEGWWCDLGDGRQLHVSEGGGPGATGAHHFCLVVDDWRGAIDELRATGIDVEVRASTGQAFLRDPSGNRIELNSAEDRGAPPSNSRVGSTPRGRRAGWRRSI